MLEEKQENISAIVSEFMSILSRETLFVHLARLFNAIFPLEIDDVNKYNMTSQLSTSLKECDICVGDHSADDRFQEVSLSK